MAEIEACNEANACDADEVTYPPLFSDYARLIVKELIEIKVIDKKNPSKVKELIPHTYSRVAWNNLTGCARPVRRICSILWRRSASYVCLLPLWWKRRNVRAVNDG